MLWALAKFVKSKLTIKGVKFTSAQLQNTFEKFSHLKEIEFKNSTVTELDNNFSLDTSIDYKIEYVIFNELFHYKGNTRLEVFERFAEAVSKTNAPELLKTHCTDIIESTKYFA